MEKILTEYTDQKQREAFMEELLQEAAEAKNIILLMDNIDKYVSSGTERIDLSVPLEKYGHTSAVQIIGITTPFMYEKYIFTNDKISQMFTKLEVAEISKREAMLILMDMVALYESRYQLVLPFETLLTTIEKSDFFITTIPFPEKALQLVDTACVYTQQNLKTKVVTPEIIDVVLTQKTHTPTTLSDQIKEKLLQLEKLLSDKVIHQDEAINELASALRRSFLLLGKRKKPLASFLFLGPTGVGKTETAKAISQTFFGSDKYMIRFDMSLYQTKAEIPALVGSIETLNPGLLTNAIREKPYGVLLLDEIEKADKDLLNIFLTILDEGYFTDGFGKRVDCKNLVIIATSNAGADWIYKQNKQPELQNVTNKLQTLITDQPAVTQPQTNNTNALINYLITQRLFSPEFLNRFDGVISFQALGQDSAVIIARKMLNNIITQIFDLYKVKVIVSDATLQAITQQGYDPAFGGRNLERILRDQITDKIAKLILENKVKEGDMITL